MSVNMYSFLSKTAFSIIRSMLSLDAPKWQCGVFVFACLSFASLSVRDQRPRGQGGTCVCQKGLRQIGGSAREFQRLRDGDRVATRTLTQQSFNYSESRAFLEKFMFRSSVINTVICANEKRSSIGRSTALLLITWNDYRPKV
jgi:hypothetical protein